MTSEDVVVEWSGEQLVHNLAVDVGQPEIPARETVSQLFVVETQQVQHRGVQVMYVDRVLDGPESEVVSCAVGLSAPNTASR